MASILDRDPDVDKKVDTLNSIASDFAEDAVVHDFGYSPSYARVFRSLGSMSLTMAVASFSWASSSSICTITGLFTGWVPTNPIIFTVAIATCAAWFLTASIRMDKASLVFIVSVTAALVLVSSGIPFTSAATVFGDYTNYSDWDKPVSVPFTFFCAAWVITGWNAPSAVAEETHNARIVAPRSTITTYCLQAGMGMLFCILLAFCITDMEAAASYPTGYTAFNLLIERWGLKDAGAFLLSSS
ncbi:amino-acid permease [Fusarium mundagurra]|uniref:Amino-acid permease n=1 Tax=Fusarium mundagurra TaxID=1567541 RepID=A0A8H6DDG1_9HYPO|nr:amino-acid permease [Fusarium mundagurra]